MLIYNSIVVKKRGHGHKYDLEGREGFKTKSEVTEDITTIKSDNPSFCNVN